MAQLWCTGPALCYVASQNQPPSSGVFLGTAEDAPRIDIRPNYEPVFNDFGGNKVPFDMAAERQDALIEIEFTRWQESVMVGVINYPASGNAINGTPNSTRGSEVPGDVGTLMLTEGQALTVWIIFPYASKPAFSSGGSGSMVTGYRFPACLLAGETYTKLGTKPRKVAITWHALGLFFPGVSNVFGYGGFLLYDFTTGGLPPIT